MAVNIHCNVHVATTFRMEIFDSKLKYGDGADCGDVVINQESFGFVTHHIILLIASLIFINQTTVFFIAFVDFAFLVEFA